jgi:hypothetical protein
MPEMQCPSAIGSAFSVPVGFSIAIGPEWRARTGKDYNGIGKAYRIRLGTAPADLLQRA